MDAMSVDYSCCSDRHASISHASQKEMEVDLCWAYNRWVTEKVLPDRAGACNSMLCLPFSESGCLRPPGQTFGGPPRRHRLYGHDGAAPAA